MAPIVKFEEIKHTKQEGTVPLDLVQFIKDGAEVWDILPSVIENIAHGGAEIRKIYMDAIELLRNHSDKNLRDYGTGLFAELPDYILEMLNVDMLRELGEYPDLPLMSEPEVVPVDNRVVDLNVHEEEDNDDDIDLSGIFTSEKSEEVVEESF